MQHPKIVQDIHETQDDTNDVLDRILRQNEHTINIAAETASKLKEQHEKIK
jgi:hypothetical protein